MKGISLKKVLNNWHLIILLAVLGIISVLNFRGDYSILTNDNYSPELNPSLTINRIIYSPAWREYRSLGVPSDSESADLFRAVVFEIFSNFLSVEVISQGYILFCLVVGVLSFASLSSNLFSNDKTNRKQYYLLGGIFYLTTLWTAWVFVFPMMPYVAQFGFLPLLLLSIFHFVGRPSSINALKIFLAGLLLSTSYLISTLFFINLGLVVIFSIWRVLKNEKFKSGIKKIFIIIFLTLVPNLIWILPFPNYLFGSSGEIMDSSVNRQITESTIDVEKEKMTGVNSMRFYTRLLDTYDSNDQEFKMFKSADNYIDIEALNVLSFVPVLFCVIGLIFVIRNKHWYLLPVWVLAFVFWLLLKNQNDPLGSVYMWLQENISVFRQVFRWPTSKFGQVFLVGLCLSAVYGAVNFFKFICSFGKGGKKSLCLGGILALVILQLSFAGYLFYGELAADRSYVQMPEEYDELSEYFDENDPNGRLFIIPTANNSYFREYNWGFIGSGFMWYQIPNPMLEKALSVGSAESDFADRELENSYLSEQAEEFWDDLDKYDVEYLLVDRSLVTGRYGYELDWSLVDNVVSELDPVWSKGNLELYETNLPTVSEYETVNNGIRHEFMDEGFVSIGVSDNPTVYPLSEKYSQIMLDDNYIEYTVDTSNIDGDYADNFLNLDIESLPSKLLVTGDKLIVKPSIPEIEGIQYDLPYKEFTNDDYDYFVIGDTVVNSEDIGDGYIIDYPYGQILDVFGLDSDIPEVIEHKTILDKNPTQDCTGQDLRNSVDLSVLNNGNFVMSSDDGIGCVYSEVNFPGTKEYVVRVDLSWEAELGTDVGFCIWSSKINSCLNDSRFYTTTESSMTVTDLIPQKMSDDQNLSFTLYIVSKDHQFHSAEFKEVKLSFYSEYEQMDLVDESEEISNQEFDFSDVDTVKIKIPLIKSVSSYYYDSTTGYIGEPLINSGSSKDISYWVDKNGSGLFSQSAIVSYYNPYLNKGPLGKYIISYYLGQNIKGIPASLCISYLDDDKCWIGDSLLSGEETIGYIHFLAGTEDRLDLKITNTSFSNESENSISQFLIQSIPEQWVEYSLIPIDLKYLSVTEMSKINKYSSLYLTDEIMEDDIISIPQAVSSGWRLYGLQETEFFDQLPVHLKELLLPILGERLSDDNGATVDGWKQAWDISDVDEDYETFVVSYSANNLGYIGLYIEMLVLVVLIILSGRELFLRLKNHGKK